MADNLNISVLLNGQDKGASASINTVASSLTRLAGQSVGADESLVSMLGSFGKLASISPQVQAGIAGATIAIGAMVAVASVAAKALAAAAESAGELQQQVANISTIKPEINTGVVFRQLSEMSTRVNQTSKDLGDSLYNIFSSLAISEGDALKLTEQLARGAVAAGTDAKSFGTAIVGVMNTYKQGVGEATHDSDVFFNVVNKGVIDGKQLAAMLGLVTPAAKAAGLSVDELGGFIAGVTQGGKPAAEAMNDLNNLFVKIADPHMQAALKAQGIAVADATGKFRPMIDVVDDLAVKLGGMTEVQKAAALAKIAPDIQARAGLQAAISQRDLIRKTIEENKTLIGTTDEAYKKMSETFIGQTAIINNTFTALKETIGIQLIPPLTKLMTVLNLGARVNFPAIGAAAHAAIVPFQALAWWAEKLVNVYDRLERVTRQLYQILGILPAPTNETGTMFGPAIPPGFSAGGVGAGAVRPRGNSLPGLPGIRRPGGAGAGPMPGAPAAATTGGWDAQAAQAAQAAGVPIDLFVEQMRWESAGFDEDVIYGRGKYASRGPGQARGIAQIVSTAHPGADVYNPAAALAYGANLMSAHLAQYGGRQDLALAAYNAGPGAVAQYGGVPPFDETQLYVREITRRAAARRAGAGAAPAGAQGAAMPPGSGPIHARDPWGNEWNTTQDALNRRPGGYSDLTLSSGGGGGTQPKIIHNHFNGLTSDEAVTRATLQQQREDLLRGPMLQPGW